MTDTQRKCILICDDSDINRIMLNDILSEEYNLLEAADGKEALCTIREKKNEIDLVLLDIVMPELDGFQVLEEMNLQGWVDSLPVIMITAETAPNYTKRAYELGASDFINRPFDPQIVLRRIKNTTALYAKQKRLTDMVAEEIYAREKNSSLMVSILSHIVEFRNGESGLHVQNINVITELLLKRLLQKTDVYGIPAADIPVIKTASSLHDIGKIAVPHEILNKPGKLTPEEYEIMKVHSAEGGNMMSHLPCYQDEPLVKYAYQICRWHHERWNGKGYPDKLSGDDIPISAQIVSVADVYDALTSARCYKPAYTHEKAMEMILGGECGEFNPLLIECLKDVSDKLPEALQASSRKFMKDRMPEEEMEQLRKRVEVMAERLSDS